MGKIISESPLPLGARGFYFGDLFFQVQPDKIVFGSRKPGEPHYTLMLGHYSGIIDLHKTSQGSSGMDRRETIGAIKVDDIQKLANKFASPIIGSLSKLIRPVSIGWLAHRHIGIVKMPYSNDADLNKTLRFGKRKRFTIDGPSFAAQIEIPEYLDSVLDYPDGMFTLVARKRKKFPGIGFLYKVTLPDQGPRLFWVKTRDLYRVMRDLGEHIFSALKQHAVSETAVQEWLEINAGSKSE